ncbi:golgin subfamily B member 1-like [Tachysurus vachellii]|uniref:golgin subfamily B member 1-like n=1 Tax=Tachysurus vachellii TaxID=175792 RepID=UPI00296ADFF1|nr:golgin subfamily B member 1-like [Tachysurus vachellii]
MRNFSLAEAEERHQKVMKTITELMEEKTHLEHQVETLTHMAEDSEKIYDTCLQWRKSENLSLAQAEEKHQKTVENISQLEEEKSNLRNQVTTMRDTVTDLGYKLYEAHLHRDKLINRRETERQAHRILQVENDELKTALMYKEELLKVSLSEAEEKHQKAVENITQLEEEKSDLTNQVETLRDTIQDMEDMFYEAQEQCDEIISFKERQAHRILQVENDELKTTLMHKEELLKLSLAQAEEKHQKTVENISQLEEEKSNLRNQVTTMRDTVTDLGYKLYEAHLHRDKLINRRETERQAHRILQVENDELKTALMHKEELLKVSLSEAEEKHQKAVENITQLEEEKSDLTNQKPGKSLGTKETTNTETESSVNRSRSSSESV